MDNPLGDFENDSELKFAREQGFFDRSPLVRIAIGLIFAFCLFLLLHFREVRLEVLEIGSVAPSYVVAQVDFTFLDEEATAVLKREAKRDISIIYRLPEREVRERRGAFEKYLVQNQEWRSFANRSTFEEMYDAVGRLEKALLELRLTDPRTLQKIVEMGLPAQNYRVYSVADENAPVVIPKRIWRYEKSVAFANGAFQDETVQFILAYFQQHSWRLEPDAAAKGAALLKIESKQPNKYTNVSAGSRIIDQGEKVTTRHAAMLQAMKKAMGERRYLWHPFTLLGSLILTFLFLGICILYFRINHPKILHSNSRLFLLVTIIVVTFAFAKVVEFFLISSHIPLFDLVHYPIVVPFAAILLSSLVNPSVATFASGFLTIVLSVALAFGGQGFMILNLTTSFVAILSVRNLRKRKEVFVVCGKAWLVCVAAVISLYLYENSHWIVGGVADIVSTGFFLLLTAVIIVGLLPLFESAFHIMTDVTLMEYADPNNELLRRLTVEAPGTYQHSVIVGNLAEVAALSIRANGLFCRVASLYHDIGKMLTPLYFTENQHLDIDIHQLLTPQESAEVILAHVSDGVTMARKAGLPEQFVDVIKEHHGTTLVYFFYKKQLDKVGGDKSLVDEGQFRYAGPKPRSKECAIIMLADSLEAASRSLENANEESITRLANSLIQAKAEDGQFDHCLLTFEELVIVKNTLIKTLVAFGHSRVKYPSREGAGQRRGPALNFDS